MRSLLWKVIKDNHHNSRAKRNQHKTRSGLLEFLLLLLSTFIMTEETAKGRKAQWREIIERTTQLTDEKNYSGMVELVRSTNAAIVLDAQFNEFKNDFGTELQLAISVRDIMLVLGDPEAPYASIFQQDIQNQVQILQRLNLAILRICEANSDVHDYVEIMEMAKESEIKFGEYYRTLQQLKAPKTQ
jgi:hypothetical protein